MLAFRATQTGRRAFGACLGEHGGKAAERA
jgi:hypothetical protein